MGAIKDVADEIRRLIDKHKNLKFAQDLLVVQSMIGDIQSEQARLQEKNFKLMKENEELKRTIGEKNSQEKNNGLMKEAATEQLSEDEENILLFLGQDDHSPVYAISQAVSQNELKTKYFLDKLLERNMVGITRRIVRSMNEPTSYYLRRRGREYLVENDLV